MNVFMTRRRIMIFSLLGLLLLIIAISVGTFTLLQQRGHGPQINPAEPTHASRYEKFELTFPYTGSYSNPNDPAIADIEAIFTAPGGHTQTVPGFFFQDFTRGGDATREVLTPVAGSEWWKVRYAPSELGTYTYTVTLKDSQGTNTLGTGSFDVTPSTNPGFIKAVGHHFERDNGQPFIPLGVNAPWFEYGKGANQGHSWGDGTYGVDNMYKQFVANGANYFHLWTCSWNKGRNAPFAKPNIGCNGGATGTEQMSQPDSWEMDYMVDQAHANNIYIMPILKHLDQQVFEYADKIKMRYFVARWGYSTNIMAWDFCKEGGTNPTTNHDLASYMDSIDPYKHPRTTSQWNHYPVLNAAHQQVYNKIFSDPLMSIAQDHDYQTDCSDPLDSDSSLYVFHTLQTYESNLQSLGVDKPIFIGETGVHPCAAQNNSTGRSTYINIDKNGLILKGEIWGTLMASSGGYAPWDFQFDPHGAWTQFVAFKGASAYAAALPPIPDSASLFSTYQDASQAATSASLLRVIGRKNATFAMLYIQNTSGTWGAIVRDKGTATPVSGTVILKGMQSGSTFSVRWYDTDTGALLKTDRVTGTATGLLLTLPGRITQSVAAIVTTS